MLQKTLFWFVDQIVKHEIDDPGFKTCLAEIQKLLGQASEAVSEGFFNGFQAARWSAGDREDRLELIADYLREEILSEYSI